MTPRSEAIAFRAWQVASRMEWDCTIAEVADEIGVSPSRLASIAALRGWSGRFRASDTGGRQDRYLGYIRAGTFLESEAAITASAALADIRRQGVLAGGSL